MKLRHLAKEQPGTATTDQSGNYRLVILQDYHPLICPVS